MEGMILLKIAATMKRKGLQTAHVPAAKMFVIVVLPHVSGR